MVGLLAASSIFAGINFSGGFKGGYKATISFDNAKNSSIVPEPANSLEGTIKISAKDDDGIWTVDFSGTNLNVGEASLGAKAVINFDKLAAKLGSDWGSWTFKLTAGTLKDQSLSTAYKKTGGKYEAAKMNGYFTTLFDVSDGNWVNLQIGIDPTFGASVGEVASFMISAKSTPIDGLDLSLGYIFNGKNAGHVAEFDFTLDLAKMIGVDFDLFLSGGDTFMIGTNGLALDPDGNKNVLGAGIKAGIDIINGYAEIKFDSDFESTNTFGAIIGVDSNCGLEGFDLSASLASDDFAKFIDNFTVKADASYEFSFGLTTKLSTTIQPKEFKVSGEVGYDFGGFGGMSGNVKVEYVNSTKSLSITPTLGITF